MACNITLPNGCTLIVAGITVTRKTAVAPPGAGSAEAIALDDLDNADAYKQFCAGVADAGEFTFECKSNANNQGLFAKFREDDTIALTFPSGGGYACDGFLQEVNYKVESGKPILITGKWKCSGTPTLS